MTPLHTYTTVDKSTWAPGPWHTEPDKVQWRDEATGLPCLIVRGPSGALCGYVGVGEGHPAYGFDYDCAPGEVSVHGGLTFSGLCQEGAEADGVCHRPEPGEPDNVWWFGFDCAHCGDVTPGSDALFRLWDKPRLSYGQVYRDLGYVQGQLEGLARTLAKGHPGG